METELTIQDIVYPGKGLARDKNGRVIFVKGVIDREIIKAEITKNYKTYSEARVLEIKKPSPFRVKPICDHWNLCSSYQIIDYHYQIRIKLRQLARILKQIYPYKIINIPNENPWFYRNKIILHIDWENEIFGYKSPQGKIIQMDTCALADQKINEILPYIGKFIKNIKANYSNSALFKKIGLRVNKQREMLLMFFLTEPTDINIEKINNALNKSIPKTLSRCIKGVIAITAENSILTISGQQWLEDVIKDKKYRYYGNSFFQINIMMAVKLIEILREQIIKANSRIILDLFCGCGFLGLSISDIVKWIYAVEIDSQAYEALRVNSQNNPFGNFSFKIGKSGKLVWEIFEDRILKKKIDTVIVDPPRNGLSKSVREFLRKNRYVKNVFYISCDPMTLYRDLKELKTAYILKKIFFLDFFPHTYHIETLTVLRRKK